MKGLEGMKGHEEEPSGFFLQELFSRNFSKRMSSSKEPFSMALHALHGPPCPSFRHLIPGLAADDLDPHNARMIIGKT
jgi:hypothetical protein